MAADKKQQVSEIKESFKKIQQQPDDLGKKAAGFDKDLSTKIFRVKEGSEQIVKHITERQEGNG
jgi:hypothetical protein